MHRLTALTLGLVSPPFDLPGFVSPAVSGDALAPEGVIDLGWERGEALSAHGADRDLFDPEEAKGLLDAPKALRGGSIICGDPEGGDGKIYVLSRIELIPGLLVGFLIFPSRKIDAGLDLDGSLFSECLEDTFHHARRRGLRRSGRSRMRLSFLLKYLIGRPVSISQMEESTVSCAPLLRLRRSRRDS